MYTKVELCGVNTATLKVLKNKETIELIKLSQNGNLKARDELISGNLRLVLSVIKRFSRRGENPDDLFQVGCIGLIKAIDHFDLTHGVQFSTYGVPMIIGEIRRYLRDNNSVRVSRSLRDIAYKAMQCKEKFLADHLREPTVLEISELLEISKEDVVVALESIVEPLSLYEPVFSDGNDTVFILDQVGGGTDSDWLEEIALKQAIKNLDDREKKILNMRFMNGKTQMNVASELSISQAQVSRIEKFAMKKIKSAL